MDMDQFYSSIDTRPKNPYNLPTVLDWSDERGPDSDASIFVTTIYGLAFEAGDDTNEGSHVSSYDTVAEAKSAVARKRLQKCECPRCADGLMREQIARDLKGTDNTPQADGFRGFPEWIETTETVRSLV